MQSYTNPDGFPYTPHRADVVAWRDGGTGSDRAYASGVLIIEPEFSNTNQRVSLWLFSAMSGFDGGNLVPLSGSGPKYADDLPAGEAWAPAIHGFEKRLAAEMGSEWNVRIGVRPAGGHQVRVRS